VDGIDHIGLAGTISAHNAVDTLAGCQITRGDILEIQE
jgi:hypothetical protein